MAVLQWDESMLKFFENGVSKPVLFAHDPDTDVPEPGVAWEGLISVTEKPTGAEVTKLWANNSEYAQLVSREEFEGTLEAYTYPTDLNRAMGVATEGHVGLLIPQQSRSRFSLSYQTQIHSDGGGENVGYQIHILYNLRLKPSERAATTVNESPEALTFSWDFTSKAEAFTNDDYRPVSKVVIDSRTAPALVLDQIEEALYGTATENSEILFPDDLLALFTA
jgi:hypothetical protein